MYNNEQDQEIRSFHNGSNSVPDQYKFSHFNIYNKDIGPVLSTGSFADKNQDTMLEYINHEWENSEIISVNAVYLNPENENDGKVLPFFYIDKKRNTTILRGEETKERVDKSKLLELMKEQK